jgi:uncharacterized protein YeaO (DUF488 family)
VKSLSTDRKYHFIYFENVNDGIKDVRKDNGFEEDGHAIIMADIRVKRVYEKPGSDDGVRVLVDRLWPRGLSRESAAVDVWMCDIAPSNGLRRWFGHDPAKWDEFRRRYWKELDGKEKLVDSLLDMIRRGRVTLLYSASDIEHNNAVALQQYLGRKEGATARPTPRTGEGVKYYADVHKTKKNREIGLDR